MRLYSPQIAWLSYWALWSFGLLSLFHLRGRSSGGRNHLRLSLLSLLPQSIMSSLYWASSADSAAQALSLIASDSSRSALASFISCLTPVASVYFSSTVLCPFPFLNLLIARELLSASKILIPLFWVSFIARLSSFASKQVPYLSSAAHEKSH